jgi:hypothetical protein
VHVIRLYNGPARELITEWQSHWMTIPLNNLGLSCAKLRRSYTVKIEKIFRVSDLF